MKKLIALFAAIFTLAIVANTKQVDQKSKKIHELSTQVVGMIKTGGLQRSLNEKENDIILELNKLVEESVLDTITKEANDLKLSREAYIAKADSMDKFLEATKKSIDKLESLTEAQRYTLLIRISLRFQIQQSFLSDKEQEEKDKVAIKYAKKVATSLGLEL